MFRTAAALAAVLFLAPLSPQSQDVPPAAAPPATPAIPPEAAKLANPVKATPESLAHAKKTYGYDCVMCHGKQGRGDGELAVSMKLKLLDLSDAESLKKYTDGELFYILKNGKGQMPPEGDRGRPDDLWNLVHYVRSLSAGGASHGSSAPDPVPATQP